MRAGIISMSLSLGSMAGAVQLFKATSGTGVHVATYRPAADA